MKQVSLWAKNNIFLARILLICCKVFLSILGFYLGILLAGIQIKIPSLLIYGVVFIAVYAIIWYPHINLNAYAPCTYGRRKAHDFVIALCGFLCVVSVANHLDNVTASTNAAFAISRSGITPAEKILASLIYRDKGSLTKSEKKVLKRALYRQVRLYAKATLQENEKKKKHTAAIILIIFVALGLLGLISSLACSLYCAGNDVAASLIYILGATGIVLGTIALIKRIKRGKPAGK